MENPILIVLVSDDERLHRKISLLTQQYHTAQRVQWLYPAEVHSLQADYSGFCFIDLDSSKTNMIEWLSQQKPSNMLQVYCFSRTVAPEFVQKVRLLSYPTIIPRSKMEELLQKLLKP